MPSPPALSPPRSGSATLLSPAGSVELAGLPGRFCLHYQPDLVLADGSIRSCEALLRWWDPEMGTISPGSGRASTWWDERLRDIEEWVVAEVCRQGAAWAASGTPLQVALNLSERNIVGGWFLETVEEALASSGVDPSRLAVDLPARTFATEPARLRRLGDGAAALGVAVVIDGVSAGCSLDAFAALSAEVWKIDVSPRRLRRARQQASVVKAVTRAHEAGALAVAKQIERPEMLAALTQAGFDRASGHAISPPVSAQALGEIAKHGVALQRPLFGRA